MKLELHPVGTGRVTADLCPFPGYPSTLTLEETEKTEKWERKEGRAEMKKNPRDTDCSSGFPFTGFCQPSLCWE